MQPIISVQKTSLALSFLLLAGCAEFNTGFDGSLAPYPDSYTQSDFDELLAFGDNMAKTPPSSREKVCRTILKRQKDSPDTGVTLHLMMGRLLSDTCGEIPKILNAVDAIPPERLPDDRMRKLVAIHTEALKRLSTVSKKASSLERKQKSIQSVVESKNTKDSKDSKKNENSLLREKLEAIRSMEKHLDESVDAN
jgi:hypothetical protein